MDNGLKNTTSIPSTVQNTSDAEHADEIGVDPGTDGVQSVPAAEPGDSLDELFAQLRDALGATAVGGCVTLRVDIGSELGSKVGLVAMRRSQDGRGTPIDAVGKVAL